MSQSLPFDEIETRHGHPDLYMNKLEEILNTPVDSDIGYFVEVDLRYPDETKQKPKKFPLAPEKNKINPDNFSEYMKNKKPKKYIKAKKINMWLD